MGEANLKECLSEYPHKGFSESPHYYADGDYLTYYASEDRCHSIRVNELLTVYVSVENDSLVGCKVKGVQLVMKQLEELHIAVSDGDLALGLLFVSVAAITEEADTRSKVNDYGKEFGGASVPRAELKKAA